jgi:ribosomal protein S18 acetylase RimI-like enzyme
MNALCDLTSTSAAALHELELQLNTGHPWPIQRWRNLIEGKPWHARAVLVREQPVGVAVVDLVSCDPGERRLAWIMTLHVHPAWRELGVGSLLLDDLVEHASVDHVTLLQRVPESDERMLAFYQRRNFQCRGQATDSYYESGANAQTIVREA